jgi:O-antigen biosynthesis protein WbqP
MIRLFDILLSLIGLIVLAIPAAIVGLIIKITSPGPAIFAQTRVGKGQRPFTCYKFRTMSLGTANVASHEVGGAAITPVGGVLRRTKIDEIPQLWNVLTGDMSLVGPRPCLPVQAELVEARESLGLYAVRPGITGPAQVKGIDMSTPQILAKADQVWLSEQSTSAYFNYIFQTVLGAGQGDAVTG